MWYKAENGSIKKPPVLDRNSSKAFVYVRKDFVEVPECREGEQVILAHWTWMETKIPKETWVIYEKAMGHDEALDDVYTALTELAEMITEG